MIYFFYGDEEFNISNEIKKFKDKLDRNFIEMGVIKITFGMTSKIKLM